MGNRFVIAVVGALVMAGAGIVVWKFVAATDGSSQASVTIPTLSEQAAIGKKLFDANCAKCHGANAAGSDNGPPFIHDIYNPGHHSDRAFYLAASRGVRRHHWNFGDMPPVPGVTRDQIAAIVRYVREMQQANGIYYRPHRM